MSRGRKTITVEQIKEWANQRLAYVREPHVAAYFEKYTPDQVYRMAVASLIEQVLHETGNYKGFSYLESEKNPDYVDGVTTPDESWLREGYDNTRRRYS